MKKIYAGAGTDFGYACSPTLVDGKVVLPIGGAEASIVASDVPQGEVYDFSQLLGIEPEYAMDPPTVTWLWRWYLAGGDYHFSLRSHLGWNKGGLLPVDD